MTAKQRRKMQQEVDVVEEAFAVQLRPAGPRVHHIASLRVEELVDTTSVTAGSTISTSRLSLSRTRTGSIHFVAGARAAPPEDAGGVPGYQEFLAAITPTTKNTTACSVGSVALFILIGST
jgi:hypothetical protein